MVTGRIGARRYGRCVPVPTYADVERARRRVDGVTRRVVVSHVEPGTLAAGDVWLAHEYLQHTGSFKARGAQNFTADAAARGALDRGVVIASGGNAGLACAWAARENGTTATVFVPTTAPAVKVERLHRLGADVRQVGRDYHEASTAAADFAASTGAVRSHAYDHPLIAAGAGTLLMEALEGLPEKPDTVVVAVGGGGLFTGTAVASLEHGLRVVAAEPEGCRALGAAIEAGGPVDSPVDSVAADSLGARRCSSMAYEAAVRQDVVPVAVTDPQLVAARRALWAECRVAVEHGAATALAALTAGAYRPSEGERVLVVLCGANTDPSDLAG